MAINIEPVVRENLNTRHMSLGTVGADGRPWVCELDFVSDPVDLTLCFRSPANTDHCLDIADRPDVAGTIAREHRVGEAVLSVAFRGVAGLVTAGAEQARFAKLFSPDPDVAARLVERAANPADSQFYAIHVTEWFVWGALGGGRARKYRLPWGSGQ